MSDEPMTTDLLYVQPHLQRHGTTISSNPQPFKGTDKRRCCEIFSTRAGMLRAEFPPEPDTEGQLVWLNFDGADSGMSEQVQFPISVPIERISRMVVATLNGIAKHRDTARTSGAGLAIKH